MHPGKATIMKLLIVAKRRYGTLKKIASQIGITYANLSLLKSKNVSKPFIHLIFDKSRGLKYFRLLELLEPTIQDIEMMCEWSDRLMCGKTSLDVLELLTKSNLDDEYYSKESIFEIDYSFEKKISMLKEIYKRYPEIMQFSSEDIVNTLLVHMNNERKKKRGRRKKKSKEANQFVPQKVALFGIC